VRNELESPPRRSLVGVLSEPERGLRQDAANCERPTTMANDAL
jgi:hypothetical protein